MNIDYNCSYINPEKVSAMIENGYNMTIEYLENL